MRTPVPPPEVATIHTVLICPFVPFASVSACAGAVAVKAVVNVVMLIAPAPLRACGVEISAPLLVRLPVSVVAPVTPKVPATVTPAVPTVNCKELSDANPITPSEIRYIPVFSSPELPKVNVGAETDPLEPLIKDALML